MLHEDDVVEEIATKRRGKIDSIQLERVVGQKRFPNLWGVGFSDGKEPATSQFKNEDELRLLKCPHDLDGGDRSRKNQNLLMVVFTGLILVVTCVYSYFSWGQWTSMGNALEETKTNRELEYRAYVGVKGAILIPRPDNPAWGDVMIIATNTGRTPALDGKMRYRIENRQNPLPEDTKLNQPDVQGGKTVYAPMTDMSTNIGLIPTNLADQLMNPSANQNASSKTSSGKLTKQPAYAPAPPPTPSLTPPETLHSFAGWYAYGIIDYSDIFGNPHWTKFCFFNTPKTSNWGSCPTFNDADTKRDKAQ